MIVIEKNEGKKIEYIEEGNNLISFRDELFFNLARYERDYPVEIDICENHFGMLTAGVSEKYIAQIKIPAREYEKVENGTDKEGNSIIEREAVPFNMDNTTLILWSLEG